MDCTKCGHAFITTRPNTKCCAVCRFERDMTYLRDRKSKCWVCREEFAPINAKDSMCAACDTAPSSLYVTGACTWCAAAGDEAEKTLLHDDLRLCLPCVKNVEKRPQVLLGLKRKVKARQQDPQDPQVIVDLQMQCDAENNSRRMAKRAKEEADYISLGEPVI